ncbi:MAG: helix-turn-helix transcriptional regulator [Clostridia bacterium]|nr:helix-turn-helix transcriptional regulator [Clostridia bacterium]
MNDSMTTGAKLARLRREARYTQEQLAELLDVSRQSISKWESDAAYPETEKLIRLGELYGCSMDYLLKEDVTDPSSVSPSVPGSRSHRMHNWSFEWKSERTIRGIPLVHIHLGFGKTAKGIFAVGLAAKGVCSVGIFSMGLLSFGVFSLGLLALGAFSLGVLSAGALALGLLAFGGLCMGIVACGGVAVGCFAAGGVAIGKYLAVGDHAFGEIALGITHMSAKHFGVAPFHGEHLARASGMLEQTVPWWLSWAKRLVQMFL